jgi:hypothetical protein
MGILGVGGAFLFLCNWTSRVTMRGAEQEN